MTKITRICAYFYYEGFALNFGAIEGFNSPLPTFFLHKLEERSEDWNIKPAASV